MADSIQFLALIDAAAEVKRMSVKTKRNADSYPFTIRPLSEDEGGGYLVEYPDIPGCMSDGETIEEAIANGREALLDCMAVLRDGAQRTANPSCT